MWPESSISCGGQGRGRRTSSPGLGSAGHTLIATPRAPAAPVVKIPAATSGIRTALPANRRPLRVRLLTATAAREASSGGSRVDLASRPVTCAPPAARAARAGPPRRPHRRRRCRCGCDGDRSCARARRSLARWRDASRQRGTAAGSSPGRRPPPGPRAPSARAASQRSSSSHTCSSANSSRRPRCSRAVCAITLRPVASARESVLQRVVVWISLALTGSPAGKLALLCVLQRHRGDAALVAAAP